MVWSRINGLWSIRNANIYDYSMLRKTWMYPRAMKRISQSAHKKHERLGAVKEGCCAIHMILPDGDIVLVIQHLDTDGSVKKVWKKG